MVCPCCQSCAERFAALEAILGVGLLPVEDWLTVSWGGINLPYDNGGDYWYGLSSDPWQSWSLAGSGVLSVDPSPWLAYTESGDCAIALSASTFHQDTGFTRYCYYLIKIPITANGFGTVQMIQYGSSESDGGSPVICGDTDPVPVGGPLPDTVCSCSGTAATATATMP